MPHSYTYAGDVARGLLTLGERAEAVGQVWHLPTPPAESTPSLARRLGHALGLSRVTMTRIPRLGLRAAGLFSRMMRELPEMAYQWEVPFVIDDTRFRTAFGEGTTSIDDAVASTAAWARRRYGLSAAA